MLTKQKKKHHQSGLLYSMKNSGGDIELDALRNYLRVNVFEFRNVKTAHANDIPIQNLNCCLF